MQVTQHWTIYGNDDRSVNQRLFQSLFLLQNAKSNTAKLDTVRSKVRHREEQLLKCIEWKFLLTLGHHGLGVRNNSGVKITHSCSILRSQKTFLQHNDSACIVQKRHTYSPSSLQWFATIPPPAFWICTSWVNRALHRLTSFYFVSQKVWNCCAWISISACYSLRAIVCYVNNG